MRLRVYCAYCQSELEFARSCSLCHLVGYLDFDVPDSELPFYRAILNSGDEEQPQLLFSDRLLELGLPDEVVDLVRHLPNPTWLHRKTHISCDGDCCRCLICETEWDPTDGYRECPACLEFNSSAQ